MRVGVNYPWLDYGWDFGPAPPAWRRPGSDPRWFGEIDAHLRHLQDLGITIVRWFILADGLTYGSGPDAPQPDARNTSSWHFDPPFPHDDLFRHFSELLDRFAAASRPGVSTIQLLPVLVDFHFCDAGAWPISRPEPAAPGGIEPDRDWVKQGRAEAITDTAKRRRFLDRMLDPLLAATAASPEVVFAWEVINEPEWVTSRWHPDGSTNHPVDEASMRAFLEESQGRIRAAGLTPTIGFAVIDTLRSTGITAEINQFHHYPDGRRLLERHPFAPSAPGIVGEFATAATDVWPGLPATGQTVLNRLQLADAHGYPAALPWSFTATDRHTSWSAAVEGDIATFTQAERDRLAELDAAKVLASAARSTAGRPRRRGRCEATTRDGVACSRRASAGARYCWQHANKPRRRRRHS